MKRQDKKLATRESSATPLPEQDLISAVRNFQKFPDENAIFSLDKVSL
ncbi:MAG: hypothetical protein ACOX7X_02665 [Methanosarcina flavescens]|nr:hypothetical protein [Methanosarcina flavescens]